ncbi:hypothetical protein EPO05_05905, partial [Patescibacteria group bacterium]
FGLNAIKNVGANVSHEIVEERKRNGKFSSLADLMERLQSKDFNKKSIEALAKVGALDAFEERGKIIANVETIINFSKTLQKNRTSNQTSLFGEAVLAPPTIHLATAEPATKKQRLQWEKELLGLYVSDHPASEYKTYFEKSARPIASVNKDLVGQKTNIGGVITKVQKILLKNQKSMLFVTLEDLTGRIELLVFPKTLDLTGAIWTEDKVIIATGSISDKDGNFKLLVDSVKEVTKSEVETMDRIEATRLRNGGSHAAVTQSSSAATGKLCITLPPAADQKDLQKISQLLDGCQPGDTRIVLNVNGTKLETPYCVTDTAKLIERVRTELPGSVIEAGQ